MHLEPPLSFISFHSHICFISCSEVNGPCFYFAFRVRLQKMPSIREMLREMGVSVEQVLTDMAQRSADDPSNGTVPTPLTNYLDVRLLVDMVDNLYYNNFI